MPLKERKVSKVIQEMHISPIFKNKKNNNPNLCSFIKFYIFFNTIKHNHDFDEFFLSATFLVHLFSCQLRCSCAAAQFALSCAVRQRRTKKETGNGANLLNELTCAAGFRRPKERNPDARRDPEDPGRRAETPRSTGIARRDRRSRHDRPRERAAAGAPRGRRRVAGPGPDRLSLLAGDLPGTPPRPPCPRRRPSLPRRSRRPPPRRSPLRRRRPQPPPRPRRRAASPRARRPPGGSSPRTSWTARRPSALASPARRS